jgi:hypothetical protein
MTPTAPDNSLFSRRDLLAGAAALTVAAPLAVGSPASGKHRDSCDVPALAAPVPVALDDAALMSALMKLRGATDARLTIGWVDAVSYGFVDGETFPLYRLLAANWQVCRKISDVSYSSTTLEIAHFVDMKTGVLLDKLTMPPTGEIVDVPHYRSGPSASTIALHREEKREFNMGRESADGARFFIQGTAISSQHISQAERDGNRFRVREDLSTRVVNKDPGTRGFFYREWSQWSGSWREVFDPAVSCARCELGYSAAAAWRPWMKMGNAPGNTVQNGRGGKVERPEDLPAHHLQLTKQIHADLLDDPWKALKLERS